MTDYRAWDEGFEEGELVIDILYSDLVGERYEKLKEKYWGKKE